MFFVGSTGPILTFLLTFILPIFLLTAKQTGKELFSSTEKHHPLNLVAYSSDTYTFTYEDVSDQKNPFACSLFCEWIDQNINEKYPAYKHPLHDRLINLKDSGNKAPPVSYLI